MENKEYQDEFELFLQDEIKQHRMYPSDHIWKNIRTELHGYKAWPALTFISLFIVTALTITTLVNNHPEKYLLKLQPTINHGVAAPVTPLLANSADKDASGNYFQQIITNHFSQNTLEAVSPVETVLVAEYPESAEITRKPLGKMMAAASGKVSHSISVSVPIDLQARPSLLTASSFEHPLINTNTRFVEAASVGKENESSAINQQLFVNNTEAPSSTDRYLADFSYNNTKSISARKKPTKFGYQLYITPSTSYRRLSDAAVKEVIQPAAALQQPTSTSVNYSANVQDVNNVVRHRPAMGWEVGVGVLYNLTNRLKLKTGLQLNIRQYYIETFQSNYDLASLSLINYRGIETVNFYSTYNNNTGYKKAQLDNKVYQISIPLGIQWDIIKGNHFGINTEASIQPTFTLNNDTYLLSSDYKHYTNGGDFIRKWNINTSLGLHLTYTNGASTWQIGPQVRYQHLPTYSNLYPVKEYLLDYGIRLGFTRQIR